MEKFIQSSKIKKISFLVSFFGVMTFSLISFFHVISINTSKPSSGINDCTSHHGNHYEEKAPTYFTSGNKEFWICCNCHEVFLETPSSGKWNDNTLSEGLPLDHKAYIAPWDYVKTITIEGADSVKDNEQATFSVNISPSSAHNKEVTWSIINGTASGTITDDGLFTPTSNLFGDVTIVATAKDGSLVSSSKVITVTDHNIINVDVIFENGVISGEGAGRIITWTGFIEDLNFVSIVHSHGDSGSYISDDEKYISFPSISRGQVLTFSIPNNYRLVSIEGEVKNQNMGNYWTNSEWSSGKASASGTKIYWSGKEVSTSIKNIFIGSTIEPLTKFIVSLIKV